MEYAKKNAFTSRYFKFENFDPRLLKGIFPFDFRFLTMIAHLVITITLLLSRDENVRACLPLDHSKVDFARKDVELATGLFGFEE